MAQAAFEQIAIAEEKAKSLRDSMAEKQKADIKNANAAAATIILNAKQKVESEKQSQALLFENESESKKENAAREIHIKCSLVRTRAAEQRKRALDFIFRGVTDSGNK
ncbi:MAG: hypothetical protein RR057_00470 [Clostridia bacterium]